MWRLFISGKEEMNTVGQDSREHITVRQREYAKKWATDPEFRKSIRKQKEQIKQLQDLANGEGDFAKREEFVKKL